MNEVIVDIPGPATGCKCKETASVARCRGTGLAMSRSTTEDPSHDHEVLDSDRDTHGGTRAVATDVDARARFRCYWALVSPGISLIRLLSFRPLKRDAERPERRIHNASE
jgi:hypothetical protein